MTDPALDRPAALTRRVAAVPGQPLRVAVYARLADAIRTGDLGPGSLLPSEPDLGALLGVSRTVVREALMLLTEDGLVVTRRGIGRLVAPRPPAGGLEGLRDVEDVFAAPGATVHVTAHEFSLQPTTDFISRGLGLDAGDVTWFRESLVRRDDEPIALLMEHLPAGRRLAEISPPLAERVPHHGPQGSALRRLRADLGVGLRAALRGDGCEVTAGVAGPSRAALLGLEADDPVLVLVQRARLGAEPLYLAKWVVTAAAGPLHVAQGSGG